MNLANSIRHNLANVVPDVPISHGNADDNLLSVPETSTELPKTTSSIVQKDCKYKTAIKLLESKAWKERRNYLTLASGATVSLKRTEQLTAKVAPQMPKNELLVPEHQIKIKQGLINEMLPPAVEKSSNDERTCAFSAFNQELTSGHENSSSPSAHKSNLRKDNRKDSNRAAKDFAVPPENISAKRPRIAAVTASPISGSSMMSSGFPTSNPVVIRNVPMSRAPVTNLDAIKVHAGNIPLSKNAGFDNSTPRAANTVPYFKSTSTDHVSEDDDDSEPEFDTSSKLSRFTILVPHLLNCLISGFSNAHLANNSPHNAPRVRVSPKAKPTVTFAINSAITQSTWTHANLKPAGVSNIQASMSLPSYPSPSVSSPHPRPSLQTSNFAKSVNFGNAAPLQEVAGRNLILSKLCFFCHSDL